MLVADFVAETFIKNSIQRVFMYPGGTIAPLVNACLSSGVEVECFKSEQGAGYAALAAARISGRPQVVMVTSGPGVTNVMSCLADAYFDSTPLVLICGQIASADLSSRRRVRQRGFQEVPTVEMTKSISKHATCLLTVGEALAELPAAFVTASQPRRGPVVIDFPMDIQRQELVSINTSEEGSAVKLIRSERREMGFEDSVVEEIGSRLRSCGRPVVLLGQGALAAGCFALYEEIAAKVGALVVTSFLGVGSFDTEHPQSLGYIGHTGHVAANRAVYESDFLLVLGSRLDVRQTGTLTDKFAPGAAIAWVDIDEDELNSPRVRVTWRLKGDIATFCRSLIPHLPKKTEVKDQEWRESLRSLASERREDIPGNEPGAIFPRQLLDLVATRLRQKERVCVVTGVGCHQHWASRHLPFSPGKSRLLTSGGHGTMGYDLPTAIGAAMYDTSQTTLCIVGDGSFLMNIQELAALKERGLRVKILLLNNNRLGIVSQFQLITWGKDPTTGTFLTPDFVKVTEGFGIPARLLDVVEDSESAVEWLLNKEGPALLEARISSQADVFPMLLAGKSMGEMWPGRAG